jgi:hypothetical protein
MSMHVPLAMTNPVEVFLGVLAVILLIVVCAAVPLYLLARWRRSVRRRGYPDLRSYLRAIPRTDAEKRTAIEMTLKGLVLCLLGLAAPGLVFIGVVPLYYGARKLAMAWLGLEILDNDGEKTA